MARWRFSVNQTIKRINSAKTLELSANRRGISFGIPIKRKGEWDVLYYDVSIHDEYSKTLLIEKSGTQTRHKVSKNTITKLRKLFHSKFRELSYKIRETINNEVPERMVTLNRKSAFPFRLLKYKNFFIAARGLDSYNISGVQLGVCSKRWKHSFENFQSIEVNKNSKFFKKIEKEFDRLKSIVSFYKTHQLELVVCGGKKQKAKLFEKVVNGKG